MLLLGMDLAALLGGNVRRLRLMRRLSQEEAAHRAGLDRTYLSDIERGLANPTIQVLRNLGAVLGVHPAALLVTEQQAAELTGLPVPMVRERHG